MRAAAAAGMAGLAHGLGRSYGDAALNPGGLLWHTRGLDRFIRFDEATGELECEAGVLLRDIQALALARGWSLPVTPGTLWVTVGGAIANDVHGKNHHRRGNFGDHVRWLELQRTDGACIVCGPDRERGWFEATVGGIGLTGVIVRACLQLMPVPGPWLEAQTLPFEGLDEFLALSDEAEPGWEHAVSWIDGLSGARPRGLFMRSRPAPSQEGQAVPRRQREVRWVPPVSLFNRWTVRPGNALYYHWHRRRTALGRVHQGQLLYPLDALGHWNRVYGPRGFFQYQSVVPMAVARDATQAMLDAIRRSGEGSFLGVIKTFGPRTAIGMLSFPRHGLTLALDFPNRGSSTAQLFERLDAIVQQAGGRLYLAKDARMPRALFEAGYPRSAEFERWRDPGIASAMSRRLMGS